MLSSHWVKNIAVDGSEDMRPFIGHHTEIIDAGGKVVAPGFCESHMHCAFYGAGLLKTDLQDITVRQEVLKAVAKEAEAKPDG